MTNETEVEVTRPDTFNGDDTKLMECIDALLDLDDAKALVPHGLGKGSHAYVLLNAARHRIASRATDTALAEARDALAYMIRAYEYEAGEATDTLLMVREGSPIRSVAGCRRILAVLEGKRT